ncbi:hypothetical protein FA13DRAFT_1619768, partial [Coprinellus micaceus]
MLELGDHDLFTERDCISPQAPETGDVFDELHLAMKAAFAYQLSQGYIWRKGQSTPHPSGDGSTKKVIVRCNHYQKAKPKRKPGIDPSDQRRGKSIRTECFAHVNINYSRQAGVWKIGVTDWNHNHPPPIPEGGTARQRPTGEQVETIRKLATSTRQRFSRAQIAEALAVTGNGPELEPRQISALMTKHRREAQEQVLGMGGGFSAM